VLQLCAFIARHRSLVALFAKVTLKDDDHDNGTAFYSTIRRHTVIICLSSLTYCYVLVKPTIYVCKSKSQSINQSINHLFDSGTRPI